MRYLALVALLGFCMAITVGCDAGTTPPPKPVEKPAPKSVDKPADK